MKNKGSTGNDFFNISFIDLISGALGIMSILLLVVVPFIGQGSQPEIDDLTQTPEQRFATISLSSEIDSKSDTVICDSFLKDEKIVSYGSTLFKSITTNKYEEKKMIVVEIDEGVEFSFYKTGNTKSQLAVQTDSIYIENMSKGGAKIIIDENGEVKFETVPDIIDMIDTNGNFRVLGIEMVLVEGNSDIENFYIGKYEVTNKEYALLDKAFDNGKDNYPVENLSYDDAMSFCQWLTDQSHGRFEFNLPNEKEWEYAYSGGKKSSFNHTYSGGDNPDEVAYYSDNSNILQEVGKKKENALGIYDMSGNVREIVLPNDVNNKSYYYLGGSVECPKEHLEKTDRNHKGNHGDKKSATGFRIICREK